ncbi:hypothetical protein ONE63_005059 [Megalurothrips usitatus]|uniref:UDP-glucuronosyltransferase n=1 Tax=Megalurothrips usitatus TaxID=439358 RepID=A0AAV7X2G4_9NEOP|nr:hypothetical protein ONE63_005059 [Megalurothrips usitatus]
MATQPGFPWMFDRVGGVDNPSYLISGHVPLGGKMTLWERIYNTCMHYAMQYLFKIHVQDPSDDAVREYFGPDTPPIAELVKRTNLLMVNGHVSLNPARPVNPNTIYVSGLHVQVRHWERPTRPCEGLEADLCRWMDGADRGVILFTFGSMVRSTTLPAATKRAFKDAFAALGPHYRVLWKYEEADDDMPANVRTATWLPQFHVLAHPKTVLFVTHAGLMGSTEAVALGVPMLALPLFTDQPANAALFTHQGIAEQLHHSELVGAGAADRVLATLRTLVDTDR